MATLRHEDTAVTALTNHTDDVRRQVRTDRLLMYDIAQGWRPLCDFPGVPGPRHRTIAVTLLRTGTSRGAHLAAGTLWGRATARSVARPHRPTVPTVGGALLRRRNLHRTSNTSVLGLE